jgi:CheY-like chemotaxis protein
VKLYLPRYFGVASEAQSTPLLDPHVARAKAGETVLVVEDEDGVRQISVETLTELGYAVLQADSAEAALDMLDGASRIDLLFTDIVMPGINGRKLAELATAGRPGLKVIYTTGYTRNAVIHNGMLDPGVAFIAKPFSSQQLATKVRQVLDGGGVNRLA